MTDRLALIRSRHAEAGGGDADKAWLIAEVERLRYRLLKHWEDYQEAAIRALDEAIDTSNRSYHP
jgi:hypothetical protein